MARFFKFRTLDEIAAECERLALDIHFSSDLSPLFRPVQVGRFAVGNSLCIQPMEGCDGSLDGKPDELTFRRFRRFGAGGAKLIWGEAAAVVEEGRATTRQIWICERNAAAFERIVRECRGAHRASCGDDSDLLLGIQLTHSGRYSYPRPLLACHDPLLDPRTVAERQTGRTVRTDDALLSDDYLARLVDHYVAAARVARKVGFDFVDVKQCHRYLLNELLSATTRLGRYGGSLENRTRLARDIFAAIGSEVPDLLLASRLNVFDGIPFQKRPGDSVGEPCRWQVPVETAWGTLQSDPLQPDLTEPLIWIAEMQRLGVQLLNVSMGNPYASPHIIRPFESPPPDGYETPEHPLVGVSRHFQLAATVQRAAPTLAVVGSGYSYLQEFLPHAAAANLRDGRISLVGIGRAALSQPDFMQQLRSHGELDRKRVCRTFSYCTALMRSKHNDLGQFATGCPPFDKDVYGKIWQESLALKEMNNGRPGDSDGPLLPGT